MTKNTELSARIDVLRDFLKSRTPLAVIQDRVVKTLEYDKPWSITSSMTGYSFRLALQSIVELSDGVGDTSTNWMNLVHAWRGEVLHFRCCCHAFDQVILTKNPDLEGELSPAAQAADWLALAIAFGAPSVADWCGERLIGMFTKGDVRVQQRLYEGQPSVPFIIRLYARWRGIEANVMAKADAALKKTRKGKDETHRAVLDAWDSPDAFAKAVESLSEYCAQEQQESHRDLAWVPLPCEYLALSRIRKDMGLPMPKVKHPFFGDNPLANPPDPFSSVPLDDLLKRVIARCKKVDPKLDVPWKW